ncbi:hypothetical protein GA0070606_4746 [Micromonospora citrea]|uniref:Uncharacterized protein n=1 Tax=Micromonospora citrea TaxID=47855 RepID=A0A1C6VPI6_9ACTN|nr:hypothetical protein GA0070606_4746 [Micromonospora citrea]
MERGFRRGIKCKIAADGRGGQGGVSRGGQAQGQFRADLDRLQRALPQPRRHGGGREGGVAVGVEPDEVRHDVRAEPVPVAAGPVEGEPLRVGVGRAGQAQHAPHPPAAAVPGGVQPQVLGEDLHRGEREPRRAVGVAARAPAPHVAGGGADHLHRGATGHRQVDRAGQVGQAPPARPALAGRLAGQVAHHLGGLAERAGVRAERDEDSRAEGAAHGGQPAAGDLRPVRRLPRDPPAVVAAGQDARPVRHLAQVEDLPQPGAGGALHHRRPSRRAGDGQQHRSGLVVGAERRVLVRAEPGGDRELGVRLGVGQQRGQAADAGVAGPSLGARRDVRQAVDPVDQCAALAGDEPVRHGDDAGGHRHATLPERLGQGAVAHPVVGHAHDDLVGVQRVRGQRRAVEDQVRGPGEQHLVLPARRLALGGVDHHHSREVLPLAGLQHRAELPGERESRPSLAPELGALGEPEQVGRLHRPERPVHLLVSGQVEPSELGEARREPGLAEAGHRGHGRTRHLASPRSPAQYAPSTASAVARRRRPARPSPAARRARREARSTRVGVSSAGGGTSSGTYRAGGRQ